ncbi:tetratricopeptide repeat protein [Roseivirga sp. BDSF3-8]|uniref:tetratricopeptide repeat protein n=1 Tax=Roseivirga sp. BDSF3-8 TaxID=3241598 RepID=UPI0035325601
MTRYFLVCMVSTALFLCSTMHGALAQNPVSQTEEDRYYEMGLDLLDKDQFGAARQAFEKYIQNADNRLKKAEAQYYIAYTSIVLGHNDGEVLLERFLDEYPDHPRVITAYYDLGNYYYKNNEFVKAAEALSKTDVDALPRDKRYEARFMLGYASFARRDFDTALQQFDRLKTQDGAYKSAASYYAGYIHYRNGNYDKALADLTRAGQDPAYQTVVPYMIANVYYSQRRYDELIAYTEPMLQSQNLKNRSDILLLTAEAYFMKEQYEKASTYFDEYRSGISGRPADNVLYRMAFTQYATGQNDKAIKNFEVVALKDDSLGQYASYYLGDLYLEQGNKEYAVTAFQKAHAAAHDARISQEALFQEAKVLLDLARYSTAIDRLQAYTSRYPQGRHRTEAAELLGEAYLYTNNYDQAIAYLESLDLNSPRLRKAYQKVTYLKASELFNAGKFANAVAMWDKSANYPEDKNLLGRARFWQGEAFSIGRKYPEAINAYGAVFRNADPNTEAFLRSRYGIGYAYYNTKQYDRAMPHFRQFVAEADPGSPYYADALMRLGDTYYIAKQYGQAQDAYNRSLKSGSQEGGYVLYQQGVVYGLQGKADQAVATLSRAVEEYPNSPYADDAMFEKARIQFEESNYSAAVNGFSTLISRFPQSEYVPFALLRRGLSNNNLGNTQRTEEDYKRILESYTSHEVAQSALLGLQEVLNRQSRGGEADRYVAMYKKANPGDQALETIEFEAARTTYFSKNYDQAINSLKEYLRSYPSSPYTAEAKFYLAESYYQTGRPGEAIKYYQQVSRTSGTFANRSLRRIADIGSAEGQYAEAIPALRSLANNARNIKEKYTAWSGLVRAYYSVQKYDSVSYYARLIIDKGNVDANAQNLGYLYLGKAAMAQNKYDQATDHFLNTMNTAVDAYSAEAQYRLAEIQYRQNKYEQSIQTLYDLSERFGAYEEWIGKAFLLIADNFLALDNIFQAKATLNSIVENSPDQNVVKQAKAKLTLIEEKEETIRQQQNQTDTTGGYEVIEN